MLADFEESFRSNYLEAIKDTPVLPPDRVRKALMTGVFEGSWTKYLCEQEVEEATSLINGGLYPVHKIHP